MGGLGADVEWVAWVGGRERGRRRWSIVFQLCVHLPHFCSSASPTPGSIVRRQLAGGLGATAEVLNRALDLMTGQRVALAGGQ